MAIAAQHKQLQDMLRRIEQELATWTAQRVQEIGTVSNALAQQGTYARYKSLSEAKAQVLEQIRELNAKRQEQQRIYLVARSAREMLTELKKQQRAEWEAKSARREARTVEDLFTARRSRE